MHIQEGQDIELRVRFCEGSSILSRVAACLIFVALTLHVTSVASPYWLEASVRDFKMAHTGLWQECQKLLLYTESEYWSCSSYDAAHHVDFVPGFLKATQAFAILGLLCQVAACVVLVVFTLLPKLTVRRYILFAAVICSGVGALFVLIAMSIYPAKYPNLQLPYSPFPATWSVSWCFGLDFVSMVLAAATSVILLYDFRRSFMMAISDTTA
ncbi:hypothetical protein BaRGS_00036957 [Batillaria attramentaria]|uniref:Uncharacterized protein n=1 Tax=Batillaria attramentaria TaxID=370345 RepID=A0ABD0JA06_9CAEN